MGLSKSGEKDAIKYAPATLAAQLAAGPGVSEVPNSKFTLSCLV
jgi:hypothetical protein